MALPACPESLKALAHYLKTAAEHEARDAVVAYWCRLHALQLGMKRAHDKTPEETGLLIALMDWLEQQKKLHQDNDAITNDIAAQAHLENYALKLFLYADKQDRQMNYGKNVVKAFYTSGMIYDVLTTFGELTEEASQNRKYAKWKAAYIHNCLKTGETPVPGPMPADRETPGGADTDEPSTSDNPPGAGLAAAPSPIPPAPAGFGSSLPDPSAVNRLPPVPYTPEPNPGGFVPYSPATDTPSPGRSALYGEGSNPPEIQLTADQIAKAQKYCKWASSALNYDDTKTAVANLTNALQLLQTGRDPA